MRLQQLEIAGFKSFSDRSHLSFDRGVTAIVGPERVRQEQRRRRHHLGAGRAERQEPARRPDGRRDLQRQRRAQADRRGRSAAAAERRAVDAGRVARCRWSLRSIRLDDDKPSIARTVEVTRRLYRSGESEYLIDGEMCRLRDVHELLMDTGLGAKAYAIIEQGKIGMILSSRPADRRQLIEEAAGITKYKARRRAAELKLEAAHAEPDAPRRHHFRAREAVRLAQAPVGESAPLQAAARRAAALGEAAVRRPVSGVGAEDRIAARAPRGCARARGGGGGGRGRGRVGFQPRPHLARRGRSAGARLRARRSTPASSTSTGASSRLSSTASRSRRSPRAPKKCAQSWRRSRRAASPDGFCWPSGGRPPRRRSRTSSRPPPSSSGSNRNTATRTGASRGSKPTSKPRGRRCFRR